MTIQMKYLKILFLFSFLCSAVQGQKLTFAPPFTDHMVLQRNSKVCIWGSSQPDKSVVVKFQDQKISTTSDINGKWKLYLNNLKEGGPYKMYLIQGQDSLVLKDILVGEVWLAGGQSNMQFRLDKEKNWDKYKDSIDNKSIRYLFVPQKYYEGHTVKDSIFIWRDAVKDKAKKMSAVAYFFAKELYSKLNVPIGIIFDYKGGTPAESWISRETLIDNEKLKSIVEEYECLTDSYSENEYETLYANYLGYLESYNKAVKKGDSNIDKPVEPMGKFNYKRPYGLYETMLKPIMPYTVKGVIWYQGEANASRAEQYKELFPTLIKEWRNNFNNDSMPFYFVQLSNYDHPAYKTPAWAELREAQLETWNNTTNTAMVVSIDHGMKDDIHPTYKEPIGYRLACCALNKVYGFNDLVYSGPIFKSFRIHKNKIILNFDHIGSGLTIKGNQLNGFEICDETNKYVKAKAWIENNSVIVMSELISNPQKIRYGWSNYTNANLFNAEGFPASPFRIK